MKTIFMLPANSKVKLNGEGNIYNQYIFTEKDIFFTNSIVPGFVNEMGERDLVRWKTTKRFNKTPLEIFLNIRHNGELWIMGINWDDVIVR